MKKSGIVYVTLIVLTICLGLLSRQIRLIPPATGDVLWALMVFFIIRLLLIHTKLKSIALISLITCYLVEISQLYQQEWVNSIRRTILGGLILGHGFLWSDLLAYTIGILIGFIITSALVERPSR
jgi:hypothetical protein